MVVLTRFTQQRKPDVLHIAWHHDDATYRVNDGTLDQAQYDAWSASLSDIDTVYVISFSRAARDNVEEYCGHRSAV